MLYAIAATIPLAVAAAAALAHRSRRRHRQERRDRRRRHDGAARRNNWLANFRPSRRRDKRLTYRGADTPEA